ncbi:hypothetical protein Q9R20_12405 [Microbacterium sp. PRF11]|uniref:hypothetical protein n=1 Tax=Microbacterium sp. PRF11 TaxID=2962593 RepID=UPI0028827F5A|nr:hypothetical protein [Microbacterium sp. PRF11]MDT0117788.1 hypothetical protein [Microbacterium sp. PRF11]
MTKQNTPSSADELARARAVVAGVEREAVERPRAVCAMCGGIVRAGRDLVTGEPTIADRRLDLERKHAGLPALHGWQRRHEACIDGPAMVRAITGRKVSPAVANAALNAANPPIPGGDPQAPLPLYAELRSGHVENFASWNGKAWGHLSSEERRAFAETVDDEAREYRLRNEDHRCLDGACGFCGVALARKWYESRLKWSDGTPAPACGACYSVARRRPDTRDMRALRRIGIEALSGASGAGLDEYLGDDMRLYVEVAGGDHSGTAEPWTFAPEALEDVREAARLALPWSLPEPLRTEYRAKVAAAREASRQRAAEKREAERRVELAGWAG